MVESHLRVVEVGMFIVDYNMGEMFLNFMLEPTIHPNTRVDLSNFFPVGVEVESCQLIGKELLWYLAHHHIL